MHKPYIALTCLSLSILSPSTYAKINDFETKNLAAFEGFCLQNQHNYYKIDSMNKALGIKPVKGPLSLTANACKTHKCTAYEVDVSAPPSFVMHAGNYCCYYTMIAGNVKKIRNLILTNYKIKYETGNTEGIERNELYAFNDSSKYKGNYLFLSYLNGQKDSGATLTLISSSVLEKNVQYHFKPHSQ